MRRRWLTSQGLVKDPNIVQYVSFFSEQAETILASKGFCNLE
jgi:hypothetical protein